MSFKAGLVDRKFQDGLGALGFRGLGFWGSIALGSRV